VKVLEGSRQPLVDRWNVIWDLGGCLEAPNYANQGSPSGYAVDAAANIGMLALQVGVVESL
jgi:hypothetical protein